MADNTKIEWTEATWNPITGCSVHSAGCTNCYAMKLAGTRLQHHPSRAGLTKPSKAGPVWTGEVRFNEDWLTQPLQWKRPRMIFVCAHADLFHENVPDKWIDRVFAVMALCPQHTFQVLTKRSDRMREYLNTHRWHIWAAIAREMLKTAPKWTRPTTVRGGDCTPLPNVWLGVSVENQAAADERIPDLLATPAAVRWISAEPLLGVIDLHALCPEHLAGKINAIDGWHKGHKCEKLDWVVAGGESGSGARPMHPDWARSLRDQCAAAGTPFFFKQWGNWLPCLHLRDQIAPWHWKPEAQDGSRRTFEFKSNAGHSIDIASNPTTRADNDQFFWWFDKKTAGRLLDGVEHEGMPA